jgi:hypothetical protein
MKQGATESNDSYLERFRSAVSTVELAHGRHIFCSSEIMEKAGESPTVDETRTESDRFKAMLLLKNSVEKR